ncbi:MAG: O-antigen ligase family protein [Gemmatimonadaceae bacterium]|nr:O-antigen ligase family protein [Gemmatimonadaceae bacterium]
MAAPSASERPAAPLAGPWLIAFIASVVLSLVLLLLTSGNPILAATPLIIVAVVYLFTALPLRVPLLVLLFLASLADSLPIAVPIKASGGVEIIGVSTELFNAVSWAPPLYPLYAVLFENLNKVLPIEALRFSAVDLLYILSLLLVLVRVAFRIRVDRLDRQPATTALHLVMGGVLLGAVWLEVWGVGLRGGDFRQSLWQFRQLFWLPTVTMLFAYAFRDIRDFNRAINLLITAVCIKLVFVVWFYFTVARPGHFEPATITSHYDSILFTVTIVALVARYLHAPGTKNLVLLGTIGTWVLLGIVLNNRRLAFVSLGASLFVVFIMLRGPMKKMLLRVMLYASPLVVAYVVVGQAGNSRIFKPAKLVTSVIRQDDRSSSTRDVENYNLLVTLKRVKLLGNGWGHEYIEAVRGDDISEAFPQYKYQAHNSVLWLWTVGGLVGFSLLWMPLCLGIFLARRAYIFARAPADRAAAAIAVSMVITYMIQAWGDLGTQHLNSTLVLGIALATAAKLAVSTGAMPAKLRFVGVRRPESRVQAQAHVAFTPGQE